MHFTLFVDGYFCNPFDATCYARLAMAGDLAAWNIAHADLALMLMRLTRTDVPLSPVALRFLDDNFARPSVKAYVEHPRPPNAPP